MPLFRGPAAAFAAALALRLAFLCAWSLRHPDLQYTRDPYYEYALSWLGWGPYLSDIEHPPLYTLFIASILWVARGADPLPALLVQTLLSSASCVLIGKIGVLLVSRRAGLLAAWLAALDMPLIYYSAQLRSESLFVFLLLAFFLMLLRALRDPSAGPFSWAGLGLLGGLAGLCRGVFAAYPLALIACPGVANRRLLLPLAAFCAAWLLPIGAWTLRNLARTGTLVPLSANSGTTLYEGLASDPLVIRRRLEEIGDEYERLGRLDPAGMDRRYLGKALSWMRDHPAQTARIAAGKALDYWRFWPRRPDSRTSGALATVYFSLLLPLALLGAWSVRADKRRWAPIAALFLYLSVVHSFYRTALRYRLPLEPFLCLLAAGGILRLVRKGP